MDPNRFALDQAISGVRRPVPTRTTMPVGKPQQFGGDYRIQDNFGASPQNDILGSGLGEVQRPAAAPNFGAGGQTFSGTPGSSYPQPTLTNPGGQLMPPQANPQAAWAADQSKWNTDGYAKPGFAVQGNLQNILAGGGSVNRQKWADPNHQTPKYNVLRILSQQAASPEALRQLLPQIQQAYPGTRLIGDDKIDIPGVGITDVGRSFGDGTNMGWAWQGQGGPEAAMPTGSMNTMALQQALGGDESTLQQILAMFNRGDFGRMY